MKLVFWWRPFWNLKWQLSVWADHVVIFLNNISNNENHIMYQMGCICDNVNNSSDMWSLAVPLEAEWLLLIS